MPGLDGSGTTAGIPGSQAGDGQQGAGTGQNGTGGTGSDTAGYGGGTDPFEDLVNGRSGGTMTTAEKRAELDARLESSYAVFDGMILEERGRVQGEIDEEGSGAGAGRGNSGLGTGEEGDDGSIVVAAGPRSSSGGGYMPAGGMTREGDYTNSNRETFPIPDDIPSGNDDDIVARQLREAAMTEEDPELREKLWDEYRNYTGIGQ